MSKKIIVLSASAFLQRACWNQEQFLEALSRKDTLAFFGCKRGYLFDDTKVGLGPDCLYEFPMLSGGALPLLQEWIPEMEAAGRLIWRYQVEMQLKDEIGDDDYSIFLSLLNERLWTSVSELLAKEGIEIPRINPRAPFSVETLSRLLDSVEGIEVISRF